VIEHAGQRGASGTSGRHGRMDGGLMLQYGRSGSICMSRLDSHPFVMAHLRASVAVFDAAPIEFGSLGVDKGLHLQEGWCDTKPLAYSMYDGRSGCHV
jgi:hypothetical protein